MKSCRLKHLVTLQERSQTQDSFGQPIDTWSDVATLRASIEPLRGRELFAAQQVNGELSTKITIRYRSGVSEDMRMVHGDVVYNLTPPVDVEMRHAWLEIMATSGVNDG